MGKRKDTPQKTDATDAANGINKSEKLESGTERPADQLANVESPELVPPQMESRADETQSQFERVAPPLDLAHAAPGDADVVTVSFAQAAAEAAISRDEPGRKKAAIAAYLRTRRFVPLAATIAIAAAVGAMAGSLATTGMTRLLAAEPTAQSARLEESRILKETIAQVGADVAALRAHIDNSAKSAGVQFARLGERLDRSDRAQAESTGKLARLTDSLERRSAATTTAASDPVTTGSIPVKPPPQLQANPPPQLHAPATRPAGQPIVEGWFLRNVYNGTAVIQGRIGLVEVEPGDTIPGLGRIETIRRQDGRWVVVTNRGLVIAH
jgi:hypothetical protein